MARREDLLRSTAISHSMVVGALTEKTRIIRNSRRKSSTDLGRALRSLAIDRRTNWAKSGVMFGFSASSEGGVDFRCFVSRSFTLTPVNGGLPETSSCIVQAKLYRSARSSRALRRGFARATCSSWCPAGSWSGREPLGQPAPAALGQGEVDQLHLAVVGHQEVVGLDVAVDPAHAVEIAQGLGGLVDDLGDQRGRSCSTPCRSRCFMFGAENHSMARYGWPRSQSKAYISMTCGWLMFAPDRVFPAQEPHLLADLLSAVPRGAFSRPPCAPLASS